MGETFTSFSSQLCNKLCDRIKLLETEVQRLRQAQIVSVTVDRESMDDLSILCAQGLIYRNGNGCPKDPCKAMDCFIIAAEQGSLDAMVYAGEMLLNGEVSSIKTDLLQQLENIGQSSEHLGSFNLKKNAGTDGIIFRDALMEKILNLRLEGRTTLSTQRRQFEARRLFERASMGGHAAAMVRLSKMIEVGAGGLTVDPFRVAKLTLAAANKNDADALASVGFLYEKGHLSECPTTQERLEILPDIQRAIECYEKSIEMSSNTRAMTNLSSLLLTQHAMSHHTLSDGAANPWAWATSVALDLVRSAAEIEQPPSLNCVYGNPCNPSPCQSVFAKANYNLGICLERGIGASHADVPQAILHYKLAASTGHLAAMSALATLLVRMSLLQDSNGVSAPTTTDELSRNVIGGSKINAEVAAVRWLRACLESVDLKSILENAASSGEFPIIPFNGGCLPPLLDRQHPPTIANLMICANSAVHLGTLVLNGRSVAKNSQHAASYFSLAIDLIAEIPEAEITSQHGLLQAKALCKLGRLLMTGSDDASLTHDAQKGLDCLRKAAMMEDAEALNAIGLCFENGALGANQPLFIGNKQLDAMMALPPLVREYIQVTHEMNSHESSNSVPRNAIFMTIACFARAHELQCLEGTLNLARLVDQGWVPPVAIQNGASNPFELASARIATTSGYQGTEQTQSMLNHAEAARRLLRFAVSKGSSAAEVQLLHSQYNHQSADNEIGKSQSSNKIPGNNVTSQPWVGAGASRSAAQPLASASGLSASPSFSLLAMHQKWVNSGINKLTEHHKTLQHYKPGTRIKPINYATYENNSNNSHNLTVSHQANNLRDQTTTQSMMKTVKNINSQQPHILNNSKISHKNAGNDYMNQTLQPIIGKSSLNSTMKLQNTHISESLSPTYDGNLMMDNYDNSLIGLNGKKHENYAYKTNGKLLKDNFASSNLENALLDATEQNNSGVLQGKVLTTKVPVTLPLQSKAMAI